MSARATDLQAQVESVLGALVKAATVELTKLFETRYGVSPLQVGVGRNEDKEKTETIITVDDISTADTKRSIGVQVENDIYAPLEASGPPFVLEEDSLRECGEEVGVQEGCRVSSKVLLYEANSYVDSDLSPLNEQVLSVDVVEVDVPDDFITDSDAQTDIVFHVSAEAWTEVLALESTQKCAAKQQPIVIQPDTSNNTSDKVNFVCPLILKPESPVPKPDSSEKQFQTEPQQRCVSSSKGTAYSPSPSDGAIIPAQVGVWERIHTPDGAKNNLHMRLKLSSADPKLMRQCTVQLVDVLKVSKPGKNLKDNVANCKSDVPLPKDLRRHQGLHTGHRICCFTSCGNHIWRLHKDVAHTRNRYACSICGKDFKRRKVLRRHERFHSGEKPYSCSACSKMFALRKNLRRHVRFHTGERPHTCTQCGKGFRLRDNLKAHLRFHTGEKPFSCATCGKMFRIMRNLEKHKVSDCQLFVPSFRTIAGL